MAEALSNAWAAVSWVMTWPWMLLRIPLAIAALILAWNIVCVVFRFTWPWVVLVIGMTSKALSLSWQWADKAAEWYDKTAERLALRMKL